MGESQTVICLSQDRKQEALLSRRTLTDARWAIIEPLVPEKPGARGRTGADNRLFVDAILWLARGAAPWRDPLPGRRFGLAKSAERGPPEFGNWSTVCRRFPDRAKAGVFERMFNRLSDAPDLEVAMVPLVDCFSINCRAVDATLVKVHRHGHGATRRKRGTRRQAINDRQALFRRKRCREGGKSKGGWTTKILALTDAIGSLVRFVLLPAAMGEFSITANSNATLLRSYVG